MRGRRGTYGTGWRAWTGLVARDARDAAALCVAGVAQPHIHRRFAWQAWHKLTSTVVLRDRRGTYGTGWRAWTGLVARDARDAAALCVAGMAQTHIHRRFAWQAWHLRGRRGTHGTGWRAWTGLVARDAAALCVAGVAQTHIHRRFAWQAWHKLTSTVVLRGRHGICVAGVALMALGGALGLAWSPVTPGTPRHFAWQAWHKLTSTVVLRGGRGTTSHPLSFCVAGVALTHTHTHTHKPFAVARTASKASSLWPRSFAAAIAPRPFHPWVLPSALCARAGHPSHSLAHTTQTIFALGLAHGTGHPISLIVPNKFLVVSPDCIPLLANVCPCGVHSRHFFSQELDTTCNFQFW